MLWILFTIPLMLLGVAMATVPVLVTMIRDERARVAERLAREAQALRQRHAHHGAPTVTAAAPQPVLATASTKQEVAA